MTYATISIDRRESYYARAAELIAADMLGFYARAEQGRKVQAAIKPTRYATPKPRPNNVLEMTARKGARRG